MPYQIKQELCSCCHQCKVNCPVSAIRFKGVKYWIDPEKCIDCGACVKNCHNCVIYKVGEPEAQAPAHETRHEKYDLVVCGSGASGLVAAVRTAQADSPAEIPGMREPTTSTIPGSIGSLAFRTTVRTN